MIWQICRAGLIDNLYSRRLQFVTIATVVLIVLSCLLQINIYRKALQDYNGKLNTQELFVAEEGELSRLYDMTPPEIAPPPLSMLVRGVPLKSSQSTISQNLLSPSSFNQNPFPELFPPLDLSSIVLVVLSLIAVMVAHNAITKEKEAGTLRLVLSNSVPRWKFIVGKWLAGILSVTPAFVVGILIVFLVATFSVYSNVQSSEVGAFFLVVGASLAYIGAFYGVGLAISSLCHSSSTSILISFVFWILVVLVLPNIGLYAAAQIRPLPSVHTVEKQIEALMGEERDQTMVKRFQELQARNDAAFQPYLTPFGYTAEQFRAMPDEDKGKLIEKIRTTSPEFGKLWEAEQEQILETVRTVDYEFRTRTDKMEDDLLNKVDQQSRLGMTLTSFLPSSSFLFCVTNLAGTNPEDVKHFGLQRRQYKNDIIEYIVRRIKSVGGANPSEAHIDMKDRPRFAFQNRTVPDRLGESMPYFGVLIAWNLLAFTTAFVSLTRYDVR
jgi:ABC-type transport system involved in multi-copper enzyme maturation permease subunit